MKKNVLAGMTFVLFTFGLANVVSAVTITFDEFAPANANSNFLSTEYNSLGLTFVHTDDGSTWGGLSNGDPGNWGLDGTNGPIFVGYNGSSYSATLLFASPVNNLSFDVSRSNGSTAGNTFTANAYDGSTILLETIGITFGDINAWTTISFTSSNIASVDWLGSGSGFHPFGVDNLQYNTEPVPEPATMFLLGTGLVGVAGAARRKKKNQV